MRVGTAIRLAREGARTSAAYMGDFAMVARSASEPLRLHRMNTLTSRSGLDASKEGGGLLEPYRSGVDGGKVPGLDPSFGAFPEGHGQDLEHASERGIQNRGIRGEPGRWPQGIRVGPNGIP